MRQCRPFLCGEHDRGFQLSERCRSQLCGAHIRGRWMPKRGEFLGREQKSSSVSHRDSATWLRHLKDNSVRREPPKRAGQCAQSISPRRLFARGRADCQNKLYLEEMFAQLVARVGCVM
jgi:hypothetical protein